MLLSNGALLELDNEQSKQNLSWPEFSFVVSHLIDDDTAHITANFLRHHVSSLKKQRNKLNMNKSKKLAFLCKQFNYNKKTSCSVSDGGASDVGVVVSTDIGIDNVADKIVTEVTNNLDSKNFSRISVLEDQILLLKNSFSEENAERLSLATELKQLKKDLKKVKTKLKIKTCRLAKLCPHNFNKRINRQKQINKELSSKIM